MEQPVKLESVKSIKKRPKRYEKPLSLYALGMEKVLSLALREMPKLSQKEAAL